MPESNEHELEYTAEALQDLDHAADFYLGASVSIAARFGVAVDETAARIAQFPNAGSPMDDSFRAMEVAGFPYRMIYQLDGSTVSIVSIAHTSRQPGFWRDRA